MELSPGRQLREAIAGGTLRLFGAPNALVARLIESAGLESCYVSGAALSAGVLALPDEGLFTLSELAQQVAFLARRVDIPLIVDAQAGFGGPINVRRTVMELEAAGAAAIQLNDQLLPKPCGRQSDESLADADTMCGKLRAAVDARRDRDLVIIARTDARSAAGLDDALDRARQYVRAGADWILPEALRDLDEFATFSRQIDAPLVANLAEFEQSPLLTYEELAKLEYAAVLYPVTLLRVGMRAMEAALHVMLDEGSQESILDLLQTPEELDDLLDYHAIEARDRRHMQGES